MMSAKLLYTERKLGYVQHVCFCARIGAEFGSSIAPKATRKMLRRNSRCCLTVCHTMQRIARHAGNHFSDARGALLLKFVVA
jgi:hypothetical protein